LLFLAPVPEYRVELFVASCLRNHTHIMPSADDLKEKLLASQLEPERVEITDTSDGCGSKFEAIIVCAQFDGVPLLERQRKVNAELAAEMPDIHAFSMKTWTPAQYEAKMGTKS
jgi:stress-induced morphogen